MSGTLSCLGRDTDCKPVVDRKVVDWTTFGISRIKPLFRKSHHFSVLRRDPEEWGQRGLNGVLYETVTNVSLSGKSLLITTEGTLSHV